MKKVLLIVVVLVAGVAALGEWRGWFSMTKDGKVDVQVDQTKFKQDKEAFSKTVGQQAKAMKDQVASLWKKSEGLTGDAKAHAETELAELEKKHERLEKQLKDLDSAAPDKFESIKQDLSKNLEEVQKKIDEMTPKLATANGK